MSLGTGLAELNEGRIGVVLDNEAAAQEYNCRVKYGNMSAVRSSVINESLIFVSYHNIDINYAFQLAALLTRCYRNVWLDRYEIEPDADWQDGIRDARARSTGAIAIVSDDYLQSEYCRAESEYFRQRGIAVTAVIARDFSTDGIANFSFSDWVDFRRWFDDPNDFSVENLLSQFPQSESVTGSSERLDYLREFIQEIELGFSKMPSSWAAMYNGATRGASAIRPRMLHTALLNEWEFTAQKAGTALPLTDLRGWVENESQFVIIGEAGSGKTFFARLLALEQAHTAFRDEQAALPIWFDLARWDDDTRSLDTFIEANWPLLSYWRHWMAADPSLIILDNWDDFRHAYPGYAVEIINWIDASPNQRFVLLSNHLSGADLPLPTVRINQVNAPLAQRFASGVLTLEQQNSFRQLLRQKSALIEDNSLAYLSIGLELLAADRALAFNQWQRNPLPALLRLRGRQIPAAAYGLRAEAVLAGLEELAWSMMQRDKRRFVSMDFAHDTVRDMRVIKYALAIGLLVESGVLLRFESEQLHLSFAAESFKRDGLIKYLARPSFNADSGRAPQKWDMLTLLVVDSLGEESRGRVVDQIADIDPFLAGMCLRRRPELYDNHRETLIQKLVDLCAQNAAARDAFHSAISGYAEPDLTAELLIGQMSRLNNKLQLWLWHEVGTLPLELPLNFLERVAGVDRSGAVSAADQLASYSLSRAVAYLISLSQRDDAHLRRNAIWLLGELKYLPTAILLLDYLDTAQPDDIEAILVALMKFAYSEILARLLRWSEENPEHRASVLAALAANKRRVTSRLLSLTDAKRLTLTPEFSDIAINTAERDIAIGLAQIAAEHVELPEAVEMAVLAAGNAAALRQRLAGAIKHLPNREGFRQLLEDIAQVLRDPPEATIIAGSNIDALLYGESIFDDISTQAETSSAGGRLAELTAQLRHSNWERRHQAVNSLVSYSVDESLPLLFEATADVDKRVRLAAYDILSRFEGDASAQKAVVAALSDPDIELVMAVTELLQGKALSDFDVLYDLLESSNASTVAAAITILGASGRRPAIDELKRLQDDERQPAQGGPAIGQRARDAIGRLEASVMQGDNPRRNGAGPVDGNEARFSDEEKVRRTLQVLRDDDWGRSQKAAKFLRKFARHMRGQASDEVRQLLCDALSDGNWSVRWAAAEALAVLRDRAAISALRPRLRDSNWIVQVAAVRALVELRALESAAEVLPLLQSQQTQLREAATEALGVFGDALAIQPLGKALKNDPDDFVRLAALNSICQVDSSDIRHWLELALSDSCLHVRLFAMRQLSPEMDESDLPILRKLLEDDEAPAYESESLRDLSIQTLRRIDSAKCRALLDSLPAIEDRAGG